MLSLTRRFLPLSGPALAAIAWKNRDELIDWAGFGVRSVRNLLDRDEPNSDIKAEARLRLALMRDPRSRASEGLHVIVENGVARLNGRVEPDVREHAIAIAEATEGIHEIDESGLRIILTRAQRKALRNA